MCTGIMDPNDERYGCDCHLERGPRTEPCPTCRGTGDSVGCPTCDGSGRVPV